MVELNRAWAFCNFDKEVPFSDLKGKILSSVYVRYCKKDGDSIIFRTRCGKTYLMGHAQDCRKMVEIESITGRLDTLLEDGFPLTMTEEVSSKLEYVKDQWPLTFFKLATVNGYVTIRWIGERNGRYSEEVGFYDVTNVDEDDEWKQNKRAL